MRVLSAVVVALMITLNAWATNEATAPAQVLALAGRYLMTVPAGVSFAKIGPSVATPFEAYMLRTTTYLAISVFVLPYEVSRAGVLGKCTVSTKLDEGAADAPVFCEEAVLTHTLTTPLGPAKWTEITGGRGGTMMSPDPPPPSRRYFHTHVVAVPLRGDGVILEFFVSTFGYKNRPGTRAEAGLWPLLRDQIVPSLRRAPRQ